ncbi:MAG: GTP 3',8-cyclase MoaA [Ruminococcaceae bacterium]|nr:GTP 3',8-cyclase MoaA [Oscillospiraceae bacterium]
MKDKYNREISYMRLSVTDRCNFRCKYCMPGDSPFLKKLLTFDELYDICSVAVDLGVKKIRLTGGEPLIRDGIIDFCERVKSISGLEELTITTNGSLLQKYAYDLKNAGVSRVNISLDTLNSERFYKLTETNMLQDVLNGINTSIDAGLDIKINVVLIGGFNIDEIKDFVELTKFNELHIRFIELMPIGASKRLYESCFVSAEKVLQLAPELKRTSFDGVAEVYKIQGYVGCIGLIRPLSNMFCDVCNRIRVTSDGKLKTCLHKSDEYDLRGLSKDGLAIKIKEAILNKPSGHKLTTTCFSESSRFMNQIGG